MNNAEPNKFINYYACTKCETRWQGESPYTNNDRCPLCNAEITPFMSKDIPQ